MKKIVSLLGLVVVGSSVCAGPNFGKIKNAMTKPGDTCPKQQQNLATVVGELSQIKNHQDMMNAQKALTGGKFGRSVTANVVRRKVISGFDKLCQGADPNVQKALAELAAYKQQLADQKNLIQQIRKENADCKAALAQAAGQGNNQALQQAAAQMAANNPQLQKELDDIKEEKAQMEIALKQKHIEYQALQTDLEKYRDNMNTVLEQQETGWNQDKARLQQQKDLIEGLNAQLQTCKGQLAGTDAAKVAKYDEIFQLLEGQNLRNALVTSFPIVAKTTNDKQEKALYPFFGALDEVSQIVLDKPLYSGKNAKASSLQQNAVNGLKIIRGNV